MYIYVPSYLSLYFALYQKFILNKEIIVITNNRSVKKILDKLSLNCVFFDFQVTIYNIYKTFFLLRKLLNSLCLDKDFYLLDNVIVLEGFYLAKHWTKGRVFYKNLSLKFNYYDNQLSIKYKLLKFLYKLLLGNTVFYKHNSFFLVGINETFIANNKIKTLPDFDYNSMKLKVIKNIKLNIPSYNSMISVTEF